MPTVQNAYFHKKYEKSIFLSAFPAITLFAGCSKISGSKSTGSMSATINVESFSVHHCTVGSSSFGGLYIVGYETAVGVGRYIEMAITNYTDGATGKYAITTYPDQTVTAT